MIAPVGNDGEKRMTNDTGILNNGELETVSGGLPSLNIKTSTIVLPHIPRDHDLLTPAQIEKVLAVGGGFVPPIPRS